MTPPLVIVPGRRRSGGTRLGVLLYSIEVYAPRPTFSGSASTRDHNGADLSKTFVAAAAQLLQFEATVQCLEVVRLNLIAISPGGLPRKP